MVVDETPEQEGEDLEFEDQDKWLDLGIGYSDRSLVEVMQDYCIREFDHEPSKAMCHALLRRRVPSRKQMDQYAPGYPKDLKARAIWTAHHWCLARGLRSLREL